MPDSLAPELVALQTRVQSLIDDDLRPLEAGLDDDAPVPEPLRRRVRERSRALGLFGMTQPVEFGGTGAGPLALAVAREALAAGQSPLAPFVFGPGPGVLQAATGALRERYLEPALRGERTGAWAFTEFSGPRAPERPTWARRDGDNLLITGAKAYVTGGAHADFYAVLLNVDADGSAPGGTAMVIVDRDTPGLTMGSVFRSLDGTGHVELRFDAARVPLANVVGTIGEGMPRALGNIGEERVDAAATACGMCLWAVRYVTGHITAGRPGAARLADREGVRLRYADMRIETYAARAMLYRTARLAEAGEAIVNEGAATKVFCTEVAGRVVDAAVQLVGGQALVVGHPVERLYRRVRAMRIAGGASDVLRLNIARGIIEFDAGRL